LEDINQEAAETWIIIGEPAKPYPFFTVRKWKDMAYVHIKNNQLGY